MVSFTPINASYPPVVVNHSNPGAASLASAPASAANRPITGRISSSNDDPAITLDTLLNNGNHVIRPGFYKKGEFTIINAPNCRPSPSFQLRRIPRLQKKGEPSELAKQYPNGLPQWQFIIYQLLARMPSGEGLMVQTLYRLGVQWCPGLVNEASATNNQTVRAAAHHGGKSKLFENVGGKWRLKLLPAEEKEEPDVLANPGMVVESDSEPDNEVMADVPAPRVPLPINPQAIAQQAMALVPAPQPLPAVPVASSPRTPLPDRPFTQADQDAASALVSLRQLPDPEPIDHEALDPIPGPQLRLPRVPSQEELPFHPLRLPAFGAHRQPGWGSRPRLPCFTEFLTMCSQQ